VICTTTFIATGDESARLRAEIRAVGGQKVSGYHFEKTRRGTDFAFGDDHELDNDWASNEEQRR
jgi:hypothetical protein